MYDALVDRVPTRVVGMRAIGDFAPARTTNVTMIPELTAQQYASGIGWQEQYGQDYKKLRELNPNLMGEVQKRRMRKRDCR